MLATLRKEEIQIEIEKHQVLGSEGLLDEDCYLCNLGDLEDTSRIAETSWLLAIKAAWEAGRLKALRTQMVAVAPTTSTWRWALFQNKQQLYGCIAIHTQVKVLEGEKPSPVIPTAMLSGPVTLAYEDSYYG